MKKYAALFSAMFFVVALSPAPALATDETCPVASVEQKQQVIEALQKLIDHWNSLSTEEMIEELRAGVEERNAEYLASGVRSEEIEREIMTAMNELSTFDDATKELYIAKIIEVLQAISSSSCSAMGMAAIPLILWPCSTLVVVSNWQSIEKSDGAATKVAKVAANTGLTALLAVTIPVDLVWDLVLLVGGGTYAACSAIASSVKKK